MSEHKELKPDATAQPVKVFPVPGGPIIVVSLRERERATADSCELFKGNFDCAVEYANFA